MRTLRLPKPPGPKPQPPKPRPPKPPGRLALVALRLGWSVVAPILSAIPAV